MVGYLRTQATLGYDECSRGFRRVGRATDGVEYAAALKQAATRAVRALLAAHDAHVVIVTLTKSVIHIMQITSCMKLFYLMYSNCLFLDISRSINISFEPSTTIVP